MSEALRYEIPTFQLSHKRGECGDSRPTNTDVPDPQRVVLSVEQLSPQSTSCDKEEAHYPKLRKPLEAGVLPTADPPRSSGTSCARPLLCISGVTPGTAVRVRVHSGGPGAQAPVPRPRPDAVRGVQRAARTIKRAADLFKPEVEHAPDEPQSGEDSGDNEPISEHR